FSSRRRHTRWPRDWSSDVCSSDLFGLRFRAEPVVIFFNFIGAGQILVAILLGMGLCWLIGSQAEDPTMILMGSLCILFDSSYRRSEERRVGKECRCLVAADR